jgi:undecaprenyl diphosphate synthase
MRLFRRYLQSEVARCVENGIRLNVIGRRDRLDPDLVRIIEQAERVTAEGARLTLRLAVDYSARDAIVSAAALTPVGHRSRDEFAKNLAAVTHSSPAVSLVDLLIRTGGERRLSDFLLWECAYAELVFVDQYWPDFDEAAFAAALREFERRERRYGSVAASPPAPQVVPLVNR